MMRVTRFTKNWLSCCLTMLLISGCQTSNVKKVIPSQSVSNELHQIKTIQFDVEKLNTVNVALKGLGYDGNQIAQSMQSTTYSQPPGVDPAVAIAGTLIAGAAIKEMQTANAIKEKNQRILPLLTKLEALDWEDISDSEDLTKVWQISNSELNQHDLIYVQPELKVSSDYRNFEFVSLVSIMNKDSELIYQNYFHIYSRPLTDKTELLSELNNIPIQRLREEAHILLVQLENLITQELTQWQRLPKANRSIRFKNDNKHFYERGTLLSKKETFVTYRTLRGEIKHSPYQN